MSKPSGGLRPQISVLGIVALFFGVVLIGMYFVVPIRSSDGELFAFLVYLGIGTLLVLWGLRAILNDIWPAIGRLGHREWSRHRARITIPALVYLVIMFTLFLGAMMGQQNMLMLVFGLMAGPFVVNGSMTFNMLKGMRATRRLPARAMVGEIFSVDLQLSNRKRWFSSWMMFVRDTLTNEHEQLDASVLFIRVPPREERAAAYQVRLMHRGLYSFGPLQVVSRFPLGLMERSVIMEQLEDLIVYPRLGRLTTLWQQQTACSTELVHQPRTRKGAFDDEFHGLREYRGGDNPRAIHWRTSAKRGTLMLREFHQARDQDLLLVVDLWLPPRATAAEQERVELAISFAATVCVEQCRNRGDSSIVLALCGQTTQWWEGPASTVSADPILELLALAEAGSSNSLLETYRDALLRSGPNAQKLLVSTRPAGDAELSRLKSLNENGEHNGHGGNLRAVTAEPGELSALIQLEQAVVSGR